MKSGKEWAYKNRVRVMMFNATFNNISVISWQSVLSMVLIFYMREAVVVMIVWVPMHSVPNTTYFLSSNLAHSEMYLIQHYVIKFVSDS
jgi:hypothetical protein